MLPTTFWLITNYSCNNRCKFCYAAEGCNTVRTQEEDEIMDFQYACDVMEEMKKCGAVNCLLIGGEPTLYPYVAEVIRFGARIGLAMKLVSNGRRLSDRHFVYKLKEAGLVHSSVSVEASTAEKHNQITQTCSFEEVLRGILNLQKAGVSNNTILTISLLNHREIVALAERMHDMGVSNILYNFSLPSVAEGDNIHSSFSPTPQDCADIISEAYLILKQKGIRISFFATIPLCLIEESILNLMIADKTISRGYHCHIYMGTGAAFEPNGNVLPCTHFVGSPLFNAKDKKGRFAYRDRFAREWEEGVHKKFIESAWRYPAEPCKTCSLWGNCVGGCPFLWMHFNPADHIKQRR